ncbi:hypothetical protein DIS24_g519 [Lasiodiplodia hormozganensis]|uniref:NmrA-like domain-containing protein n=1 Tax=Lasiodiplodia hormozganensis TaxID=869390 RepID=A0AA40D8E2_9PEZI|nr:hypothetical protein DIS24_g519 [Lasiodiplodia hormozganensis]
MFTIKNVVVIGATGFIGAPTIEALKAAGFNVTVLTRPSSTSKIPSGFNIKKVDYGSFESLKAAFEGQDAVVAMTATRASGEQFTIIDAAIAAGIKRYIPSEFGVVDYTHGLPHQGIKHAIRGKLDTIDYLLEKSKQYPAFTWTRVATSFFFEFGLTTTFLGFDKDTKTARIIDSGNERFYLSSYPFIARAVTAILANPEATNNRCMQIGSCRVSMNELLQIVEEESGEKWSTEHVSSKEVERAAMEKLAVAPDDEDASDDLIILFLSGDNVGGGLKNEERDNAALGLQYDDPRPTVRAWLEGKI